MSRGNAFGGSPDQHDLTRRLDRLRELADDVVACERAYMGMISRAEYDGVTLKEIRQLVDESEAERQRLLARLHRALDAAAAHVADLR